MKIPLTCMICLREAGLKEPVGHALVIRDDGLYYFQCEQSHESVTCLQEQKFELLFETALNAIRDGYQREAVASFTASYERFMEFFLQVILRRHNVTEEVSGDAWKKVSKQSERQLGAYVLMYSQEFNKLPPMLSNSMIELRNKVIHQGHFPVKEKAVSYGRAVFECIQPVLHALKTQYKEETNNAVLAYVKSIQDRIKGDKHVSLTSIPTAICVANAPQADAIDFNAILGRYGID